VPDGTSRRSNEENDRIWGFPPGWYSLLLSSALLVAHVPKGMLRFSRLESNSKEYQPLIMHFGSGTPKLSIIIPTHKRTRILQKCLDCLSAQTFKDFEVIVVSDGPDEKTAEMMQGLTWPFEIQYFAIPKSQQGICRNRAVEKARGDIVLLIGDDAFLAPDACEAHVRAHEQCRMKNEECRIAVLGHTTWDPSLKITKLMRWMEKSGVQFGYDKITKYAHNFLPEDLQHWFAYTINFSLPAKVLYQNQFREDVSLYGWEDIEWCLRLKDAGVRVFYEPDAKAYHHHEFSDAEVWERSKLLGISAVKMEELVPELKLVPRGLKKLAYRLTSLLPTNTGKHCRAFLRGMANS
jgi:glycosyltransferase involved in cell wall biosynthesis